MNIRLNPNHRHGGILFWLLVVIVFIVVAFIITSVYVMAKKIDKPPTFKPKWDDVVDNGNTYQYDAEAEAAALQAAGNPPGATATAYRRLIWPNGFGVTWCRTNGGPWSEPVTNSMEEWSSWQIPAPDLNLQMVEWKRMYIQTNSGSAQ